MTLDLIHIDDCLERIGEDDPEEERLFRDLWGDETQRDVVIEILQADCQVGAASRLLILML